MYRIVFSPKAKIDLLRLNRNEPNAVKKLVKLLKELEEHPRTGTGQIEQMKHCKEETWSRRISSKHRLVYRICDKRVEVLVLSAYGHYDDK